MNFIIFQLTLQLLWQLAIAAPPQVQQPSQFPVTKTETVEGKEEVTAEITYNRSDYIYPNNLGQAGTFRVRSAESLPQGALTFGIGGEYYNIQNGPELGVGDRHATTIAESLFVGYAPWENITLSLMRRNSSTTFGNPQQLISSLGDFTFSTQYSFWANEALALAPYFNILVASNFNNLAPAGSTLSAGGGLAATLGVNRAGENPIYFHFNIGYHAPQVRTNKGPTIEPETYFNFSRFNTVTLAMAGEIKTGNFIPFTELSQTIHANSGLTYSEMPSKLTLGTRILPFENKGLSILLGGDIGLGKGLRAGVPFSPDYQIIGQVSYTFGLNSTERKHYIKTADVAVVDRKFVIGRNINFLVGSAELTQDSLGVLDQIAQVIQQNKINKLLIVGHTDSSHTENYNMKLSVDRATSVKRYLVSRGLAEEIFMVQGYGKQRPRASNLTDEGRALNRRVEFIIVD